MNDTPAPSWLITAGQFFFRHRSWTPIPFMLLLVLCTFRQTERDLVTWLPGLLLIAAGEGTRLWGVAIIGKESRTRGSGVARIVSDGPYASVRNPLYVGNFLLTLGMTFVSEVLWMVPVSAGLFFIQYVPIVAWEEQTLADRFGAPYAAYCRRVPRWIPRWRPRPIGAPRPAYQWRAAFKSERSTFWAVAVLLVFMVMKEQIGRVPNYVRKHTRRAAAARQQAASPWGPTPFGTRPEERS